MKDDQDHHHHRHYNHHNQLSNPKTFLKFSTLFKTSLYITLLILVYTLGYFTSSTSLTNSNQQSPISTVIPTANNHLPATSSSSILDKRNDHNRFGPKCADPVQPDQIRPTILKHVYNGISPYHNFPPAHLARLLKPKTIIGWGSNGAVFENLIKKTRPKTIIEVGTFLGASATHMANLTRTLGLETQIVCVDDFRGWPGFRARFKDIPMQNGNVLLFSQFLQNVVTLNLTESIIAVPFSTGITLQRMCEWGIKGDLIEVDAGHDFHSAWLDINLAYKLLKKGGVIFGHDYFNGFDRRGVRRAVNLFAKVYGFNVSVDGQHWVIH